MHVEDDLFGVADGAKVDSGAEGTCLPEVGSGEKGRAEGKLAGQ